MSSVVLSGDTSGSITLDAPAVAGSSVQTLVAATGTLAPLIADTAKTASGTSVDFTSIPSWVKRITVMFNGVSTNGTSPIIVQIGDSGGFEGTGYVSTAGAMTSTAAATSNQTGGYLVAATANAANTCTGHAVLTKVDGNTWVCSAVARSGTALITYAAGDKTLSDTLDRLRVTSVSSDTFDAGTINILYE